MFSRPIVQWNYIIYFHIRDSFFNNFLHQFLEKSAQLERNRKSTRFVWFDRWLRRYNHIQKQTFLRPVNFAKFLKTPFYIEHLSWLLLHISTNKVLIYYLNSIFYLQAFTLFMILAIFIYNLQYSKSVQIFCFILYSILLTRQRNIRLFYTTFVLSIQLRY